MCKFTGFTFRHNQNPITINDSGKSVCNDQDSAPIEQSPDFLLDDVVSDQVHIGCGFIKH